MDYRGLSVKDAADLRGRLIEAGATFRVVKNRLTIRAADQAGAESLKELLEGPTAFTFVTPEGDARPRGQGARAVPPPDRHARLQGRADERRGARRSDQIESISRLPARDVLQGQFVGVLASPITTLVRGLASMISGLASQLKQIEEQGLVTGAAPEPAPRAEAPAERGGRRPRQPAEAEAPRPGRGGPPRARARAGARGPGRRGRAGTGS